MPLVVHMKAVVDGMVFQVGDIAGHVDDSQDSQGTFAGVGDPGLFGPDSVAWRVHASPSMLLGGMRALLIHALEPRAMAGVAQHSDYKSDPWARLSRTIEYVMATTYGDTATAKQAVAHVKAVHRRVRGIDPWTGRPYSAGDPELLLFVHAVEVHSFITAYRRYGGPLPDADADRYVAEMVRAAMLIGLKKADVPANLADLRAYVRGLDDLQVTPDARHALRTVLAPPLPMALRPLSMVASAAAVGLLPARLRAMYGLPWFAPAEPVVRATAFTLVRGLGVIVPEPPVIRSARKRVAA
jgi:uncharacterized protein (DUF2236 family)